jgi:hypothetical protein
MPSRTRGTTLSVHTASAASSEKPPANTASRRIVASRTHQEGHSSTQSLIAAPAAVRAGRAVRWSKCSDVGRVDAGVRQCPASASGKPPARWRAGGRRADDESRRWHAAHPHVTEKSLPAARARSKNSSTDSACRVTSASSSPTGNMSGCTSKTCSPDRRRRSRLVTNSVERVVRVSTCAAHRAGVRAPARPQGLSRRRRADPPALPRRPGRLARRTRPSRQRRRAVEHPLPVGRRRPTPRPGRPSQGRGRRPAQPSSATPTSTSWAATPSPPPHPPKGFGRSANSRTCPLPPVERKVRGSSWFVRCA